MFCPKCRFEYRERFTTCSDCNVPLVSELPPESKPDLAEHGEILSADSPIALKTYIRVFSKLGFFIGALSGLLMSFRIGLLNGVLFGIMCGISSSVAVAIIYLSKNYFSSNKLPPDALNVYQSSNVDVKGEAEQVFRTCMEILRGCKFIGKIKTQQHDEKELLISARTKWSWESFGENIELQFQPLQSEVTRIHITSRPLMKTTVFDFGRNFKNLQKIRKAIEKNYSSAST